MGLSARLFTVAVVLVFGLAGCGGDSTTVDAESGQTDISQMLNEALDPKSGGVLYRVPDGQTTKLVPASLLRNDSYAPTQTYTVPPQCPNEGTDGYDALPDYLGVCKGDDPYLEATVGSVVGKNADQYDAGVYYPTDSNSVDKRCFYDGKDYKCPDKSGAPGPADFDGTGCHAGNQEDAPSPDGVKLVSSPACQCNVDLSGNDWNDWIDHWIKYSASGDNGSLWFTGNDPSIPYYQSGGKKGKAPSFAMDLVSCWSKDKDSMIGLQNAFWRNRASWWNGTFPMAPEAQRDFANQDGMKYYWGWNEVVVRAEIDTKKEDWDAIVAKLPAGMQSISELSESAQRALGATLEKYTQGNNVALGSPDSAYTLVLKETYQQGDSANPDQWQSNFFCEPFDFASVGGTLKINSLGPEDPSSNGKGACWLSKSAE